MWLISQLVIILITIIISWGFAELVPVLLLTFLIKTHQNIIIFCDNFKYNQEKDFQY